MLWLEGSFQHTGRLLLIKEAWQFTALICSGARRPWLRRSFITKAPRACPWVSIKGTVTMKNCMYAIILVAVVLTSSTLTDAYAHAIWIERNRDNHIGLCFGEYAHNLREKFGERLGRFENAEAWSVDVDGKKVPLTIGRSEEMLVFENASGAGFFAQELNLPVRASSKKDMSGKDGGGSKSFFYARFAERPFNAVSPELRFDVVPVAGNDETVQVFLDGQPLGDAKAALISPDGWEKTLKSDGDGKIKLDAPWPGLYVLEVAHKLDKAGTFDGAAYETENHKISFSFEKR